MTAISVSGLVKNFGRTRALDGFGLAVPAGEVTCSPGSAAGSGVHDLAVDDARVRFDVDTDHLDVALRCLTQFGVRSLTSKPPSLEELFLRHYGSGTSDSRTSSGEPSERHGKPSTAARTAPDVGMP